MILDNGTLFTCELENIASNGAMPTLQLVKKRKHWFQERTIGLSRQALAQGANERIDLYVYIQPDRAVRAGWYAILGNGEQFRINRVHHVIEENTNLQWTTMEMQRLDKNYDVAE